MCSKGMGQEVAHDTYKNGITMEYGGNNKVSIAENIAAVLQLQDRSHMEVSNTKLVPDTL
jgi:hypothetical protein